MINKLKSFYLKFKLLFTSNIVTDINKNELLRKSLEGKTVRDNMNYIVTITNGKLYYSRNNGESWDEADSWSVIEDKIGKLHLAYSYKSEKDFPNSFNIKYNKINEKNEVETNATLINKI